MYFLHKLALSWLAITASTLIAMEQAYELAPITRPSLNDFTAIVGAGSFTAQKNTIVPRSYYATENGTQERCGDLFYEKSVITEITIEQGWKNDTGPITAALLEEFTKGAGSAGALTLSINQSSLYSSDKGSAYYDSRPIIIEVAKQQGFVCDASNPNSYTKQLTTVRPLEKTDLEDPRIRNAIRTQHELKKLSDFRLDATLNVYCTNERQGYRKFGSLALIDYNSAVRALVLYHIAGDPDIKQCVIHAIVDCATEPAPLSGGNELLVMLKHLEASVKKDGVSKILFTCSEEMTGLQYFLEKIDYKKSFFSNTQWSKNI